jgi:rare lipoprotein A (peptidoglycan hydrolase)
MDFDRRALINLLYGLSAIISIGWLAMPRPVLAFEAYVTQLAMPQLQKLVRIETAEGAAAPAATIPAYTYSESGVISSAPPVDTEKGKWPEKKELKKTVTRQIRTKPLEVLNSPISLEGQASYYSRAGCLGCSASLTMANGQPLNDNALTMAIGADLKHLVGRRAVVTNLATNQSVEVTITDTGGFYQAKYGNRVADLTIATKEAIGMKGGLGQVRVEVN